MEKSKFEAIEIAQFAEFEVTRRNLIEALAGKYIIQNIPAHAEIHQANTTSYRISWEMEPESMQVEFIEYD